MDDLVELYGPRAAAVIGRQRKLSQLENAGKANTAEDAAELELLTGLALMVFDAREDGTLPGEDHAYPLPEDFTEHTLPILCQLVRWRESQIRRASDLGSLAQLRSLTADERAELQRLEALLPALFLDGKAYPISDAPLTPPPQKAAETSE